LDGPKSQAAAAPERGDPRRRLLLHLFQAALASVDGRTCVREALALPAGTPARTRPVWAAAIGKAASAMMLGAHDALGKSLERGLLITKDDHTTPQTYGLQHIEIIESAHPVPDQRSLAAGARLLEWVDAVPADVDLLFLISGGASSLVEALVPGATLAQLTELNKRGLASGLAIGELNAKRAQLSRIKGGRLAARLAGRTATALFISDVPGHDPAVIGSGLMGPSEPAHDLIDRRVIASIDIAAKAARAAGQAIGLEVWRDTHAFEGPAERLAVRFAHELHMHPEQLRIWGGESVVNLPENPGRGGRNQHLALAAARIIAGHDNLMLLVAGTDGTDGVTSDAGGLVDGETCSRVALATLDVQKCLETADSGAALAAAGDLVHTGPTGTNVGDLVLGLKLGKDAAAAFLEGRDGSITR
jgi:hydroxypyruvate reductase